jgi:nitroimidazol reductase NimA-like FMN-containing flavoprotein (pyridoxamine 5'-phosphate oxidase superfamily)
MSDDPTGAAVGSSPNLGPAHEPTIWDPEVEQLDEAECVRLISAGGVGRLAYSSRSGVAILPVSYRLHEGSILFPTPLGSPTDEDLRTGIADADYHVAFEIDEFDTAAQEGWMVYIQGAASHVDSQQDHASAWPQDAQASAGGTPQHFLRITPTLIAGRRLSHN